MPTISVRISEQEMETLDRLVVAVRAYYEAESQNLPVLAQLARETTRSSALRDLLLAWKHDGPKFSREITEEPS